MQVCHVKLRDHFRHGEPLKICQCLLITSLKEPRHLAAMLFGIYDILFRDQGGVVQQKEEAEIDTKPISVACEIVLIFASDPVS